MCGKSSSPPVPNASSTAFQTASSPSSFVLPYYQQYLQAAQALGQTPFNPAMLGNIAPLSNEQIGAGSTLYNLGQQIPGVAGQFNNFANQLAANLNPVYN